ncbi:Gamma-aminobutyric acid (GABA) B receptor (Partial), partial [Seminavis robusta]|eukprot:Sro3175_g344780.1 Gamma-aminobutyric acid (GABA) B receptor (760) ;mRNA; f:6070-8541
MSDNNDNNDTASSNSQAQAQGQEEHVIHLVGSFAPLFGGRSLSDCSPEDVSSCRGGVAATAAFQRYYATEGPTLTMHRLDKQSQFVQTHPLGWATNRLVLNEYYGFDFFSSSPSLLLQHKDDFIVSQRDISDLQSHSFPLVLTNAEIPPSVSWHPYVQRVHYDTSSGTNLAIMCLAGNGEPMSSQDQIAAVRTALKDIAKQNELRGCAATRSTSLYDRYLQDHPVPPHHTGSDRTITTAVVNMTWKEDTTDSNSNSNCWTPVLYLSDFEPDVFQETVDAMALLEYPPAAVIDGAGNDVNATFAQPLQVSGRISNFTNTILDLEDDLTDEMKDDQYMQDIAFIRTLADEAEANDPIVGLSSEMPVAREGDYRRCKGGECEQGNLFADALRWKSNAHVAFVTSGGLRGSGWPAGNVTVSNIWSTLPFPNTMCQGVMTGVSLFKLIDYSMGAATFESGETQDGGRLLQVSGMKIVYNTQLQEHRVISIDIWDEQTQAYQPIERLNYYSFATDSYLCGAYDPYPSLLGEGLVVQGEVAGMISDDIHQNIVGDYLSSLDTPYQASRQGRLTNNTMATEPLNLIQTQEGCPSQTHWVEALQSCSKCPNSTHVAFSDEQLEFAAESGVAQWLAGRVLLVNRELEAFRVVPKSIPNNWMTLTWATGLKQNNGTAVGGSSPNEDLEEHLQLSVDGEPTLLRPGESLALNFAVNAEHLEAGTALGTVSFGVLDGGNFPGCVDNSDATFDILMRVTPSPEFNQLGNMRYVG